MSTSEGFWNYSGRLLRKLVRDAAPWARDNIVVGVLMIVAPPVCVFFRDRKHIIDWEMAKAAIFLYAGIFAIYSVVHLARTPWRLDQARQCDLERSHSEYSHLETEVQRLRSQAEDQRPILEVQVLETLFEKAKYPREVFLNVRLKNQRPNTSCTVTSYALEISIGGIEYASRRIVHDLGDYLLANEPKNSSERVFHELFEDVTAGITHTDPIEYGAPREGWIHFRFDAPAMLPEFCPIESMILKVCDPFDSETQVRIPGAYSPSRHAEWRHTPVKVTFL
jgi:hypothetical protein